MILRLAALGAVVLGLVVFLFFLQLVGKAPWSPPEMRHLRAMKDRAAAPDSVAPFSVADFASLPHGRPLAEYARLEERGVSFDGYVQNLLTSSDGDIHFELAPTRRLPGGPRHRVRHRRADPAVGQRLRSLVVREPGRDPAPEPGGATPWDTGPRHVRVSGWLLYDFQYDVRSDREALRRATRLTGWEIHPVTRIEVWEAARFRLA